MQTKQIQVAVKFILLPRHENEAAAPFRRIAKIISQMIRVALAAKNRVFRRSRRHKAVRQLRVGNVIERFRKKLREEKIVAQRRAVQMIFFEPAEPFAMRTIGQQTDHVVLLRPAHERERAIEQIVRAFEIADGIRRGMNDNSRERVYFRQLAICFCRRKMDLNVTAADVKKFRRPRFGFVHRFREFTPNRAAMSRAHRTLIN